MGGVPRGSGLGGGCWLGGKSSRAGDDSALILSGDELVRETSEGRASRTEDRRILRKDLQYT